jgi:hypothetical protein
MRRGKQGMHSIYGVEDTAAGAEDQSKTISLLGVPYFRR